MTSNSVPGPLRTFIVISTITYDSGVGSGVSVRAICVVGMEERAAVAVQRIGVWGAHADSVMAPASRLRKKYFFIVENLKPLTADVTYVEFSSGGFHHLRHAWRTRPHESRQALSLRADLNGFVYFVFPGGKDKHPVIGAEAILRRTDLISAAANVENI